LLARVERSTEQYLLSAILVAGREGAGPLFDQVCWCLLILRGRGLMADVVLELVNVFFLGETGCGASWLSLERILE
jgi:hypothetical protein